MRAILLAAGMGTRLRPLTLDTPKSLIEVNGRPLLERQIEFLRERGVEEIIVVTGYLAEKFDYLKDKYGVKLVNNDKYDMVENGDFSELYWDDIVKNNISKLDIRIEKISENSIYEIDNLEELDYVKSVVEK